MFNQGTHNMVILREACLQKLKANTYTLTENAYKDKTSQTKFQRKISINIVHKDKVRDCNLTSLPMKVDRMRLEC